MKKGFFLTAVCVSLFLTACGDDAKVIQGDVKTVTSENEDEKASAGDVSKDKASGKGFVFVTDGIEIAMDIDAADTLDKLGEPNSYFEAPSCAFDGVDKMYTYKSFELDTYPQGDRDHISSIVFKDDVITTKEGIAIGDPASKVIDTYGSDYEEEKGMHVYKKDGMKLCFIIKDDTVAAVEYRSTVLDEQ